MVISRVSRPSGRQAVSESEAPVHLIPEVSRFREMKHRAEPIVVLTAYDAPQARAEEAAGIDLILVGDSVGTNILGYASERDVTLADMCHHVAWRRAFHFRRSRAAGSDLRVAASGYRKLPPLDSCGCEHCKTPRAPAGAR